jgi:hypothetical protein
MRWLLVRLGAALIAFAILEVGLRIVSIPWAGPRVLLFGTPWHRLHVAPERLERDVSFHGNERAGYTKYHSHEEKWATDSRGRHRVRINNLGLRGSDVAAAKRPGVRRVLTLGASSTFGFENRDDETYPYYLQAVLDRIVGRGRFEVINFAVPHADSDDIVAMFLAEGVALAPDVVTVYEGINDGERAVYDDMYGTAWRTGETLLTVALVRQVLRATLPGRPTVVTPGMVDAATGRYLGNLERLRAACERIGARMIVVTQQARSMMLEPARLHGTTYGEEVRFVESAIERSASGADTRFNQMQLHIGAMFVVHARTMDAVRVWAARNGVTLVDGIRTLDRQRDLLATWVHLAPPANKVLAKAIAAGIVGTR